MNPLLYRMRFVGGPLDGKEGWSPNIPEKVSTHPPVQRADYFLVRLRGRRCVMVEEVCCRRLRAWSEINRQVSLHLIARHDEYLLCEICGGLIMRAQQEALPYCLNCHGYRFTGEFEAIAAAADLIALRELPWLRLSYTL